MTTTTNTTGLLASTPQKDAVLRDKSSYVSTHLIDEMLKDCGVTVKCDRYTGKQVVFNPERLPVPPSDSDMQLTMQNIKENLYRWLGTNGRLPSYGGAYKVWNKNLPGYSVIGETLPTVQWDGHDYLADVYRLIGIENDKFGQYFMECWFIGAYHMLYNTKGERNTDFVPILAGPSGCGKSLLIRSICPVDTAVGDTLLNPRIRASVIAATRPWINEFANIDRVPERHSPGLNCFVGHARDCYREPGSVWPADHPRLTAFIGTTNKTRLPEWLVRNRRYLVIPMVGAWRGNRFNPDILSEIINFRQHAWQLWAQVAVLYAQKGYLECYINADKEINGVSVGHYIRMTRNATAIQMPFEKEIMEVLDFNVPRTEWVWHRGIEVLAVIRARELQVTDDSGSIYNTLSVLCRRMDSNLHRDPSNGSKFNLPPFKAVTPAT